MDARALTTFCSRSFALREHCCFGISPFNSYFSEERIRELAIWGLREFKSMHFFIPDIPAVYTLEAQGYSREKAEWKARRQAQYLKNKIHRALSGLALSTERIYEMILDWERLSATKRYVELHEEVLQIFEDDLAFRAHCLEASRWVLTQKVDTSEILTDAALELAVKYFLAEIPLFADTLGIVGKTSSVFCYHQRVNFLEKFYQRKLALVPQEHQGFVVVQASAVKNSYRNEDLEGIGFA